MGIWSILRVAFLASLLVLAASAEVLGEEMTGFILIVNPGNPTISLTKKQVSDYFLKRAATWHDGEKILPVDQLAQTRVREAFSRAVHGKPVSLIKTYWTQRIFNGRAIPPPERDSDDAIVSFVMGNPGAIGYVSNADKVGRAKVLMMKD